MSLFTAYKTRASSKSGIAARFENAPNPDGTFPTFFITHAHTSNPEYSAAVEKVFKPHRKAVQNETLSNDTLQKLMVTAFVEANLKGWENVYNEHGTLLEFSKTDAVNLLLALPIVFEKLSDMSKDYSLFLEENKAAALGN
jgi:hypothetical protein